MDVKLVPIYFIVGGLVVVLVTYFGGHGKGPIAAFIALLPSISVVTLIAIYVAGGQPAAHSYVSNLLKLFPPWVLYAILLFVLMPRIGLVPSLLVSIGAYVGGALLIIRIWQ